MSSKLLTLGCLFLATSFSIRAGDVQPHCDSSHVGQYWPEVAADDHTRLRELAQAGDLQICSRTSYWRFRWDKLTVTVSQLQEQRKRSNAARYEKVSRSTK